MRASPGCADLPGPWHDVPFGKIKISSEPNGASCLPPARRSPPDPAPVRSVGDRATTDAKDMQMPKYAILEAPSALGHVPEHPGVERAPEVLLNAGLADGLAATIRAALASQPGRD